METLLGILLFLAVIVSPNTYTQQEIEELAQIHQAEIVEITNDPHLVERILTTYDEEIDNIIIREDPDEIF